MEMYGSSQKANKSNKASLPSPANLIPLVSLNGNEGKWIGKKKLHVIIHRKNKICVFCSHLCVYVDLCGICWICRMMSKKFLKYLEILGNTWKYLEMWIIAELRILGVFLGFRSTLLHFARFHWIFQFYTQHKFTL